MFVEPEIDSSYFINNKGAKIGEPFYKPEIGKVLYDSVMEARPYIIFEFGVLHGFSTICMAQGLRDLGRPAKIYACDVWNRDAYGHGQSMEKTQDNLNKYGVDEYVELRQGDFYNEIERMQDNQWQVDFMHIDINNCGELIPKIFDLKLYSPCTVLFEGGIKERDECWWMTKFNKKPIRSFERKYELLSQNYPGLSKIYLP